MFYHLQFSGIKDEALNRQLNEIPTNFKLSADDADAIDRAAEQLLTPDNPCLLAIKNLIANTPITLIDPICTPPN